jgi:hypothetical protein
LFFFLLVVCDAIVATEIYTIYISVISLIIFANLEQQAHIIEMLTLFTFQ